MSYVKEYYDYPFNTKIKSISWIFMNKLHREADLPAQILFYESNFENRHKEIWVENGKVSRLDKPAIIEFYEKDSPFEPTVIKQKEWFVDDVRHRDYDKPAIVEYYKNGTIKNEEWYVHGYHTKGVNSPLLKNKESEQNCCLNLIDCISCIFFR